MSTARPPRSHQRLALLPGVPLLALAACASGHPGATAAATAGPPLSRGVIVAMRPVAYPARAGATAGSAIAASDVRATIMDAVAGGGTVTASAAASAAGAGRAVEFIIRKDDGGTVSVVQSGGPNLRPGARVLLTGGAGTHIAPAS